MEALSAFIARLKLEAHSFQVESGSTFISSWKLEAHSFRNWKCMEGVKLDQSALCEIISALELISMAVADPKGGPWGPRTP